MSNEEVTPTDGDKSEAPPTEEAAAEPAAEEAGPEPTELEVLSAARDKLKDQLLRTAADFDNFRKRTKRDLEEANRRGRDDVLREILPVIDNLERAVQASDSAKDAAAVADGVRMVLRQFEETAARLGLTRVESVGVRFDPNLHDAVQQQETEEHPPGTIVAEVVPGYKLEEKLLRAAMVVVAKPPAPAAEPEPADAEPTESEDTDGAADADETSEEES